MPETNPNLQATDTVASFNGAPCLVRLQAMYAKLTTSERRVADVIIAAPAQVVQATIGDVARRSDVGVGTVGRLCSKLGYSGFPALKIALASDLTETKQGVVGYLERGDTLTDVIEKATRIAEQTLHDAAALVDPAALAQAIQALRAAQIVTVYVATGVDWGIARVLLYRLLQCGIPGRILVDVEQQALHARQDAPPMQQRNEVVIALARHTNHVSLQDLLQQVRRRDAHVILLTDMLHSDLAQSADATFVAATRSSGVIVGDVAAYMGLYHLVDVLYSALAITHNDARPQHTGEPPRQKLQTRKIDQLRIAVPYLPKTMDPQQTLSIANGRVYPLVFSTLINRDWTGSDWRLIPGLAASWQRRDAYTLDVTLRNDVTWHDGTPFTVRDVLYSFNRIQSGDQSLHVARSGFWSLDRVEQLDDASLRIITRRPDPFLEMRLASHHVAYIVPAHHHQTVGTDAFAAGDVIGTGPYHLTAWHPGASMEFAANTAYFEGKAAASHVSIIAEGEPAARTEGLLAGHYDLITDVPPDQLDRIAQAGGFRTKSEILGLDYELLFNMQASPLDRREIRQALSLGIDRQRIIDELWQGFAVHPRGSQIPGENYYDPERPTTPFAPARAQHLLEQAGYAGETLRIAALSPDYYILDRAMIEAIATMWRDLGISVEVAYFASTQERWALLQPGQTHYHIFEISTGSYNDMHQRLIGMWGRASDFQRSHFWLPERAQRYNDLSDELANTHEPHARRHIYRKLLDELEYEMPGTPVLIPELIYAMRDDINVAPNTYQGLDLRPANFQVMRSLPQPAGAKSTSQPTDEGGG